MRVASCYLSATFGAIANAFDGHLLAPSPSDSSFLSAAAVALLINIKLNVIMFYSVRLAYFFPCVSEKENQKIVTTKFFLKGSELKFTSSSAYYVLRSVLQSFELRFQFRVTFCFSCVALFLGYRKSILNQLASSVRRRRVMSGSRFYSWNYSCQC